MKDEFDVEINKVNECLVISIHDNGKGLSDEEIHTILYEESDENKTDIGLE
ncbi:hypothetical protein [Halalkalibacter lacteus]|uniref:hypothetical protein n=1 Tax=Halalkalibacter lacteus TaxID=3090663 RepID=UPI002FC74723